jgi:hypothetical protein
MPIQGLKTFIASIAALFLGIAVSILSFVTPIQEETIRLLKKPMPTPILTEQTRGLSREEQATMSASFIREFEGMMASGGGEKK